MDYINAYAGNSLSILRIYSLVTKQEVEFNAFLTDFNQTFSSNWNAEVVYGRADPIGNFQGTQRSINISWDIPGSDIVEAKENIEKLNLLTQMLYPYYASTAHFIPFDVDGDGTIDTRLLEGDQGEGITVGANALAISKPPLVRIGFANLISAGNGEGLLGWINSFSWTPDLEMGSYTDGKAHFPKAIGVAITFSVLHEHFVGTTKDSKPPPSFPFGG